MRLTRFQATQRGMMLLEVLIAILIFAIGVLGMVKMQAISSSNSLNSEDRATASLLANDLISQMWVSWASTNPTLTAPSAADLASWKSLVASKLSRTSTAFPSGAVGTLTIAGTTATVTIQWVRGLGRNVEFGESSTDVANDQTATYKTQVIFQ